MVESKELLRERSDKLEQIFATFNRMANTIIDKNPNIDKSFDGKQIEINDQQMDQLIRTGQQIQHFQSSDKYLKTFK